MMIYFKLNWVVFFPNFFIENEIKLLYDVQFHCWLSYAQYGTFLHFLGYTPYLFTYLALCRAQFLVLMFWSFIALNKVFYRPFSYCIDQAGLGAFTAKSGRKHYNPHPLTVMWMNFDFPILLVCVRYQQ